MTLRRDDEGTTAAGHDFPRSVPGRQSLGQGMSGAVSGDEHAGALTSTGSTATGRMAFGRAVISGAAPAAAAPSGTQNRIGLVLEFCSNAIDRSILYSEDIIERSNALNDLRDGLAQLWGCRHLREEQFGAIVNHLQLLLHKLDPQDISLDQRQALGRIMRAIPVRSRLTDPDLREFEGFLAKSGFNTLGGVE